MKRRVGLLGGSFDPVHAGHLDIAQRAREQLDLAEVWFLLAAAPPHKRERVLTPVQHRLGMLREALRDQPGLTVCTWEVDQPGVHYSVDTLAALAHEHPDLRWYFLMGEDSLRDLPTWRQPERLVRLAVPVVAPRAGAESGRPTRFAGVRILWLRGEGLDVTSSELRMLLASGVDPPGLPEPALRYIRGHGLYRGPSQP